MRSVFLFLFPICAFINAMTIEEKVGQILMCPIHGDSFSPEMKDFLEETKIGGVILYKWANTLTSPDKIKLLTQKLQIHSLDNTKLPLFIGIDEEGGRVERLGIPFPSAEELGKTLEPKNACSIGGEIGMVLRDLGINVNFAPVVDINSNPKNTVIGDRSFGSNPHLVAAFGKSFAIGLLLKGVMPCLKHFPGHGDVTSDSHYELPISYKTLEELMEIELVPYKRICSISPFIMTAHILFPNIDPDNSATFSKIFLQDILREKLGYKGIIITDSLRMKAALTKDLSEIAIEAFNAGNDILLIGGNSLVENDPEYNIIEIKTLHKKLVRAVQDGRISMKHLDQSIDRIKRLKKHCLNEKFMR